MNPKRQKKSVHSIFKRKIKKSITANHGPANQNVGIAQKYMCIQL